MLRHLDKHPEICVDGIRRKRGIIGYCWSKKHRGYLTRELLKQHGCLEKNCSLLERYDNASYWVNKQISKDRRLRKKLAEADNTEEMLCRRAKDAVLDMTKNWDNFKILSVNMIEKSYIKICFISLKWVDVSEIRKKLRALLGVGVMIKSVKMSEANKRKLLEENHRDEELERIHKFSANNQPELAACDMCGCFYCGKIYPASEIEEYITDTFGTALCPYCGIDAVLPDIEEYMLNDELLRKMHDYYFLS